MEASVQHEQERSQLWAIYWSIRALEEPPPVLRRARAELWRELSVEHDGGAKRHLALVTLSEVPG